MTIPSQERVRPIVLSITFQNVAENHILPMSQYADHSRRAQLLMQMVDGSATREERDYRYRSVFASTAMGKDAIIAALEGDEVIRSNYEVVYVEKGSEQRDDFVKLVYRPPANTAF